MLFDSNALVVSTKDACLHKSDLKTLKSEEWLGDNVLAFHAEWLEALGTQLTSRPSSNNVKMFPPSVVEVLCTLESAAAPDTASVVPRPEERFLLLPVSDRYNPSSPKNASAGSHWSLLLVDAFSGVGYHLDSLGDCNRTAAKSVHSSIDRLVQPQNSNSPILKSVGCLQHQENGSDCGIYVLLLTSLLHRRLSSPEASSYDLDAVVETVCADATPKNVAQFRKSYLKWLQEWGKLTHHHEHVEPTQEVKTSFLSLFSELGVE